MFFLSTVLLIQQQFYFKNYYQQCQILQKLRKVNY